MWNPPVIDEALQQRRSALGEAADLLFDLVHGRRALTICFIKSRKAVELVAKLVADRARRRGAGARRHASPPTAPATRPSSAASSSTG